MFSIFRFLFPLILEHPRAPATHAYPRAILATLPPTKDDIYKIAESLEEQCLEKAIARLEQAKNEQKLREAGGLSLCLRGSFLFLKIMLQGEALFQEQELAGDEEVLRWDAPRLRADW